MNELRAVVLVLLGLCTPSAALATEPPGAGPSTINGRVVRVSLFADEAWVTRELPLDGPPGARAILVDDLPTEICAGSLQAQAAEGIEVRSVHQREGSPEPAAVRELERLEHGHRELMDRRRRLHARVESLAAQAGYLDRMEGFASRTLAADMQRGAVDAEQMTALARFTFDQRDRIVSAVADARSELDAVDASAQELQVQIDMARERARVLRPSAVLGVSKRGPGPGRVYLSYRVGGAGWWPSYRVTAEAGRSTVTLRYVASIVQETGEDWRDVSLTVFAGRAPQDASAAVLPPLPLALAKSAGKREGAGRGARVQLDELTLPHEQALARSRAGAGEGAGAHELDAPVSLDSRAEPRLLRLADHVLAAQVGRVATPLLGPEVFREATLVNSTGADLPAGPAVVYFDGALVGRTRIEAASAGDSVTVGLGVDPSLRASRLLVERTTRTEGNLRKLRPRIALEVRNDTPRALTVRLVDRLPLASERGGLRVTEPTSDRIPGSGTTRSPAATGDGVVEWLVEVPGSGEGGQARLEYAYELHFDRNFRLVLEDRGEAPAL